MVLTQTPSLPVAQFRTGGLRFGFAAAVTVTGLVLTLLLSQATSRGVFQVALVSVVLSAWYGGLYPGLCSALLATTGLAFGILDPRGSFVVGHWEDVLQLMVFIAVSVVMSSLSETRYRTDRLLRTRTMELEHANRELEAFSYSVSHDLRWPLRAIDGYARILLDEYGTHFDATAQRYLHSMRSSIHQMDRLVEDLLSFSQLGRQPLRKQQVDPTELVHLALRELESDTANRSVDITIGTLPPVLADPVLLKQVCTNLLQNAIKFTRIRPRATIEVGYAAMARGGAYYVKDNGVGFDMKYVEKIFGVFQRLCRSEDYEGTGVGLAIVHRIVARHGGEVWAEAEEDKGATFYFTLEGKPRNGSGADRHPVD
jgi:light-regulated signal transduction histidine kinase (bacteriophytochrome)